MLVHWSQSFGDIINYHSLFFRAFDPSVLHVCVILLAQRKDPLDASHDCGPCKTARSTVQKGEPSISTEDGNRLMCTTKKLA